MNTPASGSSNEPSGQLELPVVSSARAAVSGRRTRREFLQVVAASAVGAVAFSGCVPAENEVQLQSRVLLAEDILSAYDNWYASTCRGCSAGCGVIVRTISGRAKKVEGNPEHPVNRGRLCARGQAAVQEEYHPDRIRLPLLRNGERGGGQWLPISWDEAIDRLTVALRAALAVGGDGQVALLTQRLGAHQALVVERFVDALNGAWLPLDPLPRSPYDEAVRRVFGQDRLPKLDISNTQYMVSFGADFLATWLSPVHYGLEYGTFRQGDYSAELFDPLRARRPRGYLVQVEPRFSATAANADEWLPIRPGYEGVLALSLARVLIAEGLAEPGSTEVFGGAGGLAGYEPEQVAPLIGVPAERIRYLARELGTRRPSLVIGGGLVAAQTNGTESLVAILALNWLLGSVGRDGGVLFNPPPPIEGLPLSPRAGSLFEWQQLAERLRAGQTGTVLVHDANPVYGLPAGLQFGEALARAPFVASFSSFFDETTALADLILPTNLPLEDWGDDVPSPGPGFSVLTMQQPVVRPFYATRGFYDLLLVLGDELGGTVAEALPWPTFKQVLRDGARQLLETDRRGITAPAEFERFWVQLLQRGGWWSRERTGEVPPPPVGLELVVPEPIFAGSTEEYPFHLVVFEHNTLGDGRLAHLPWLQATPDPVTTIVWQSWVEVNPTLAGRFRLREGDLVALESPVGRVELLVYVNPAAPPDVLAVPMGQGHALYGRWAGGRGINPMALLAPLVDQATGALAYAATRVRLTKLGPGRQLPKLEGTVPARQIPDEEVLKVTRGLDVQ